MSLLGVATVPDLTADREIEIPESWIVPDVPAPAAVVYGTVAQRADELAALHAIAVATASLDLDQVLNELVGRTRCLTGADACTVDLFDETGTVLTMRAIDCLGEHEPIGTVVPLDTSASGKVIRSAGSCLWDETHLGPMTGLGGPDPAGAVASLIGAPLIVHGRIIGTLLASRLVVRGFTWAHLRFLETVAAQAAVAVENARLHEATEAARAEAERRAAGMAALVEVSTRIATQEDYDALLATIDAEVRRLIPSDGAVIFLAEVRTGDLVAERVRLGGDAFPLRLPRGAGLNGWVMTHGEPLLVNDLLADPRRYATPGDRPVPGAVLIAPLPGPQGPQGVICLLRHHGPEFVPFATLDRDLLTAFGQQVGVVIDQTRLRAQRSRRADELAALHAISVATASLDLDRVLHELVARTRGMIGADTCAITLLDDHDQTLTVRSADGLGADALVGSNVPITRSFSREVMGAARAILWEDARDLGHRSLLGPHNGFEPPASIIGVPLIVQDRVIGAMIASLGPTHGFTTDDFHLVQAVGAQAAIAVANARLYADTLRLARYDPLTGLANRRHFMETLTAAVGVATRYERPLSLLVIDLDHFKGVNDTYGHLAGDRVLHDLAERLRRGLREGDQAARYAGDELAVIMPETDLAGALALAERLREGVANAPFAVGDGLMVPVTLSIGIGVYTLGDAAADLLQAADSAMYFAKHSGRDRVCGPEAARETLDRAPEQLATILSGGNQAVIEELAAAVDARVRTTAGRAAQVATVAVALGTVLGLASLELEIMRSAATVHDIGEIAIHPTILERSGPLAAWEWALLRGHPRHGHDLLANVPAFKDALPTILHHHERWDGSGYPDGLAGEAIPRGARLIAVADAWVALTSARPYRDAVAPEDALLEIRRSVGSQFDPVIVAALPQALAALDPASRHDADRDFDPDC